jgi:biotin operon repressor
MITRDQFDLPPRQESLYAAALNAHPALSYQRIGDKLGLSKQRIAQLAEQLGVDAVKRLRDGRLTRLPKS